MPRKHKRMTMKIKARKFIKRKKRESREHF